MTWLAFSIGRSPGSVSMFVDVFFSNILGGTSQSLGVGSEKQAVSALGAKWRGELGNEGGGSNSVLHPV